MSDPGKTCGVPGCTKPAVVHLTQVVNDQMSTHHLCADCAAEKGVEPGKSSPNFTLTDFLSQLGESGAAKGSDRHGEPCSFCGLRFAMFKETGRLGCPHCYATFDRHLRGLLRRVHGATQHVGKVYLPPSPNATDFEKRLDALKRRLERSVETEDFERAALIRDQIRAMELTEHDHG